MIASLAVTAETSLRLDLPDDAVDEPAEQLPVIDVSRLPGARVVKTLNQVGAEVMAGAAAFPLRPAMLMAGDDAGANSGGGAPGWRESGVDEGIAKLESQSVDLGPAPGTPTGTAKPGKAATKPPAPSKPAPS